MSSKRLTNTKSETVDKNSRSREKQKIIRQKKSESYAKSSNNNTEEELVFDKEIEKLEEDTLASSDEEDTNEEDTNEEDTNEEDTNEVDTNEVPRIDISDDTLDYLDSQVDKFNDTNNLGQKISLHHQLVDITKKLSDQIDNMVEIIDNVNDNDNYEDDNVSSGNIDDNIMNIEKMISDMSDEESIKLKIEHYTRITQAIKKCKTKCTTNIMRIENCN